MYISDCYKSNKYNPFRYIHSEKDVFILVNTLIKNTTPPDAHKGDPIWENGEKLLLNAIFLYLWHVVPPEEQTFENVMEMIDMANINENDPEAIPQLQKLFAKLAKEDPENLAVQQYKKFNSGATRTLKSFLISLNTRLQAFDLPDMKYLTSGDELDLDHFADKKQVLFVIIPTADTTFNFIVSMLYSQLFSCLYEYVEKRSKYGWIAKIGDQNIIKVEQARSRKDSTKAKERMEDFAKRCCQCRPPVKNEESDRWEVYTTDGELVGWRGTKEAAERFKEALKTLKIEKCKKRCPIHVRMILDEFANLTQIPEFNQKLSTIRKYEMSCAIILQAISQLKELYEKEWNTIAGNCDTKLLLGSDDVETLEWYQKMLGKKLVRIADESYSNQKGGSTNYKYQSVDLATIAELRTIASDECIVLVRGEQPYWGKKYATEDHRHYREACDSEGRFEIPVSEETLLYKESHSGPLRERRKKKALVVSADGKAAPEKDKDTPKPKTTTDDAPPQNAPAQTPADKKQPSDEEKKKEAQKEYIANAYRSLEASRQQNAISERPDSLIDIPELDATHLDYKKVG